jgi:oligopeptide/dipeptide ABC transporter ATP-binding protein
VPFRRGTLDVTSPGPLLRVEALRKTFSVGGAVMARARTELRAVDGLSFEIARGETFGLVGESGCGKSTVARCVLRLIEATSGHVTFDGIELLGLDARTMRRFRRRMQMVFQDTAGSLDSRMSVRAIVEEPLIIHRVGNAAARRVSVDEMLNLVGIHPDLASRKPHQFSGGQRQRIGLARALILRPELVVLDEPISALDVSVQAQVLNLLRDLQESLQLTYLFIVHDLTVAEYFCDRLGVLYLGRLMEIADRMTIFRKPLHPYTVSLLSAVPVPDADPARKRSRIILSGEVSPLGPESGCPFQPRCPIGKDRDMCANQTPPLEARGPGHAVACHFPGELTAP